MFRRLLIIAVLLVGCAAFAFSQARPVLGILPFTGGTGGDGETIATLISMEPAVMGAFTVVPRTAALNALFDEHYFQLAGLTDSDTIAGIGRMLNADYVLSGNIRRLGNRNLIIATIVNVETFEQVAGYYRTYLTIEEVRDFLPSMSRSMVDDALGRSTERLPSLAMLP
ncbi:MAG: penicillin-binding protein activator LpoB, partial [Treponema sp.]|nr:penicillin-binding protein activator LpoB [Treponema sp.]